MQDLSKQYWDINQLAQLLHMNPGSIYNWYVYGKKDVPPRVKINGKVLFPIKETMEWINRHSD